MSLLFIERSGDVVLDLETLGTTPGCTVLSIGASTVDGSMQFARVISIDSCRAFGLREELDTVGWWAKPELANARAIAFSGTLSLTTALSEFSNFLAAVKIKYGKAPSLWGNGATFDAPILAAAYKAVSIPVPWKYWSEMCFRTLRAIYPQISAPKFIGIKHTALDDAAHEAAHLALILQHIDRKELPNVS